MTPQILSIRYFDLHRFRLQKFLTRFGEIEYFAFDAGDISDADLCAGKYLEPFCQGTYRACMLAIAKRRAA